MKRIVLDQLVSVTSSNIEKIGVQGNDLFVEFKNGAKYLYPGQKDLFGPLSKAESVGKSFNQVKKSMEFSKVVADRSVTVAEEIDTVSKELSKLNESLNKTEEEAFIQENLRRYLASLNKRLESNETD